MNFIKSIIRPGDVFVDVGTHVGTYTVPIANIVGSEGLVVAIEPSPLHKILKINVELNKLTNVIILNKALYSETKLLEFYYNPRYYGMSSLYTGNKNIKSIKIKVQTSPWIRS